MASSVRFRSCWLGLLVALGACGGGDPPSAAPVTMPVTQGNVLATGRSLDVAIVGAGLFAMSDAQGRPVFSRAGRLDVDARGGLVHAEGWRMGGRSSDSDVFDGVPTLPALAYQLPGAASTRVRINANFDSRVRTIAPHEGFDPLDPSTYNFATSVTLHDANGRPVPLTLYIAKTGFDQLDVHAGIGEAALPSPVARLVFTPIGQRLDAAASSFFPVDLTPPPGSDLLPIRGLQLDWSDTTLLGSAFAVFALDADGYPPGRLNAVDVAQDGRVTTRYDNGQSRSAGQLLLARFALGDELERVGRTGLRCAQRCAAPIIAAPGEMLLGQLTSGALEELP